MSVSETGPPEEGIRSTKPEETVGTPPHTNASRPATVRLDQMSPKLQARIAAKTRTISTPDSNAQSIGSDNIPSSEQASIAQTSETLNLPKPVSARMSAKLVARVEALRTKGDSLIASRNHPIGDAPTLAAPKTQKAFVRGGVTLFLILLAAWMAIQNLPSLFTPPTQEKMPTIVAAIPTPSATRVSGVKPSLSIPPVTTATPPDILPSFSPTPAPTDLPLDRLYNAGLTAYNAQDWAQAVANWQPVFDIDGAYKDILDKLSAAYYNWGVDYLKKNDIIRAREKFDRAITIFPTRIEVLNKQQQLDNYTEAQNAINREDWETAIAKLREIEDPRAEFPGRHSLLATTLITYGEKLIKESRYTDATAILAEVKELDVPEALHVEAQRLLNSVPSPTPIARPTTTTARLRFRLLNENERPGCISMQISHIGTAGWYFTIDGIRQLRGNFDQIGNAAVCGLGPDQEVTFTVYNSSSQRVPGGSGIPSKGRAIMVADWR
jgi:tetratricopeptide (TPR) repeat protein